jgi:hypothetical protein
MQHSATPVIARSGATKQPSFGGRGPSPAVLDCFVASLLAMTMDFAGECA